MRKITLSLLAALCLSLCANSQKTSYDQPEMNWPRSGSINSKDLKGVITIYQPQLESMNNNVIKARAAFSFLKQGETDPLFGALWINAKTNADHATGIVRLYDISISKAIFPDQTSKMGKQLDNMIHKMSKKWQIDISMGRILAMLDITERTNKVSKKLNTEPPKLLFRDYPAKLVVIVGKPKLVKIKKSKLKRVVNTPELIVFDPGSKSFYLKVNNIWAEAAKVLGPWRKAMNVPAAVKKIAGKRNNTGSPAQVASDAKLPEIIVSTVPTELIVCQGTPQFTQTGSSGLLYASNTDSDAFLDVGTQSYYLLIAGRWYVSDSPENGWHYVSSDKLPASFLQIPENSEKAYVLASISGTKQAREAVLEAQVPQTARIKRSMSINVTYDGKPVFEDIKETKMQYAVNTQYAVLKVNDKYYCCKDAVWFVAEAPEGPWKVCAKLPADIDSIPPENPLYNVKYAKVYDADDQHVYSGYTQGYNGSYVYDDGIVYGTGYEYNNDGYYDNGYQYNNGGYYGGYSDSGYDYNNGYYPSNRSGYIYPNRYAKWGQNAKNINNIIAGNKVIIAGNKKIKIWKLKHKIKRKINAMTDADKQKIKSKIDARKAKTGVQNKAGAIQKAVHRRKLNNVYADKKGGIYRRTNSGWEKRQNRKWAKTKQYKITQNHVRKKAKIAHKTRYNWPRSKPRTVHKQRRVARRKSSNLENHHRARQQGHAATRRRARSRIAHRSRPARRSSSVRHIGRSGRKR